MPGLNIQNKLSNAITLIKKLQDLEGLRIEPSKPTYNVLIKVKKFSDLSILIEPHDNENLNYWLTFTYLEFTRKFKFDIQEIITFFKNIMNFSLLKLNTLSAIKDDICDSSFFTIDTVTLIFDNHEVLIKLNGPVGNESFTVSCSDGDETVLGIDVLVSWINAYKNNIKQLQVLLDNNAVISEHTRPILEGQESKNCDLPEKLENLKISIPPVPPVPYYIPEADEPVRKVRIAGSSDYFYKEDKKEENIVEKVENTEIKKIDSVSNEKIILEKFNEIVSSQEPVQENQEDNLEELATNIIDEDKENLKLLKQFTSFNGFFEFFPKNSFDKKTILLLEKLEFLPFDIVLEFLAEHK
ncbi:hypothetical protein Hokovirus_3_282 [Hokovirus HKV1]|uniref:Uncharacterized protein n=1 Tax=Hokovirus HKV1 TaxID=1977638 RepID=A0A1V0SH09_9VIRU|nr:hypothetical protein Hokovirus_3_282 [Hokovirus HKV1]